MNATYIGNCKEYFDCEKLIDSIKNQKGALRNSKTPYINPTLFEHPIYGKNIQEIASSWERAGYLENDSVEYFNFYPNQHFDQSFVDSLAKQLDAVPCNSWISSMKPGKCVPWHWDIELREEDYKKLGNIVRYTIFIDTPQIGQIFVLNNESFHMIEQGSVYKWRNWKEWHLGFNCGLEQKYLFHFIGVEKC